MNEDIPPPAKLISKCHPIKQESNEQEPPVKDLPETTTNDQSIYSLSIFYRLDLFRFHRRKSTYSSNLKSKLRSFQ
jgi:hypothetical protein